MLNCYKHQAPLTRPGAAVRLVLNLQIHHQHGQTAKMTGCQSSVNSTLYVRIHVTLIYKPELPCNCDEANFSTIAQPKESKLLRYKSTFNGSQPAECLPLFVLKLLVFFGVNVTLEVFSSKQYGKCIFFFCLKRISKDWTGCADGSKIKTLLTML